MHNSKQKVVAFFDLDGTITQKDTLLEFIRYDQGLFNCCIAFIKLFPSLLKGASNSRLKEKLFAALYKNKSAETIAESGKQFSTHILPQLVYPLALERIHWHKAQGHEVCIVTASSALWAGHWSAELKIGLIGTEYEIENGSFSGRYLKPNCKGEEKVNRIRQQYDLAQYDAVYAYGDTPSDKPMLALATQAFYKPFRYPSKADTPLQAGHSDQD